MKLKINDKWTLCLLAGISTYGVNYLLKLASGNLFSNGILSLGCFGVMYFLLNATEKELSKKRFFYSLAIAFLFSITMIVGYQLRYTGMTECGFKGKGLIIIRSICLTVGVFPFTSRFFKWAEGIGTQKTDQVISGKGWKSGYLFLFSWIFIFLCWVPVYLAYYPSIMAYDFHRQSQEALKGFIWFNNHHPLIHTWLIWLFLSLGEKVGSYEVGMACYSLFQMLLLSSALAYACNVMYRLVKQKWPIVVSALAFGLFPYNSILSVGATKDVIFAGLFLVFILLIIERCYLSQGKKQKIMEVLIVVEGIFMILFRNNALYAVLLFGVICVIIMPKKERLKIAVICLLLMVGGKLALEGVQLAIGTEGRGSGSEKYSVLIQQFARVGYYHGEVLDEETYELIDRYVSSEYWERYYPPLSDSVKAFVAIDNYPENWNGQMGRVLLDWVKLGLRYPNEYIDAFLELTAGYWFLDDVTWAEVFGYGVEERMGALSTYSSSVSEVLPEGIAHNSKMPKLEEMLEKIVSGNSFYGWPVISNLFKTSFYCWMLLLIFMLLLYTKQKKKMFVVLFPLTYLATMFLGPVVQVRYVFPLMISIPVLLVLMLATSTGALDTKSEDTK